MSPARTVENVFALTPVQEGILFHCLLEPDDAMYVSQHSWHVSGPFDLGQYQRAWSLVTARHPALRASFEWEGVSRPVQVVWRDVGAPLASRDLSGLPEQEQRAEADRHLEDDLASCSGFGTPAPHRMTVFTLGNGRTRVVWSVHHLLLDGWSQQIVLGELATAQRALASGSEPDLPPAPDYGAYVRWLETGDRVATERFWTEALSGFEPAPLLGIGGGRGWRTDGNRPLTLEPGRYERLRRFAADNRVTMNTLISAAWALLVAAYSGTDDVVFGASSAERPVEVPGADRMVGVLLSSVPVRIRVDTGQPVAEWLRAVQTDLMRAREHARAGLTDIRRWAGLDPQASLFDTMIAFENFPIGVDRTDADVTVHDFEFRTRVNYPLTLIVQPDGATMTLRLNHSTELFTEPALDRLAAHLLRALDVIAGHTGPVSELEVTTEADRRTLVHTWNDTATPADERTVVRLFEDMVDLRPGEPALVAGGERLTFAELDERANRLAHRLRAAGVTTEIVVALVLERDVASVVAMLGVLKAGGAYVPLDPEYPQSRLAFLLEDTRVDVVLTRSRFLPRLPATTATVIDLDDDGAIAASPGTRLGSTPAGDDLAYIIYTSGSTGTPKGVEVHHRGMANYVSWWARQVAGGGAGGLSHYSLSFDTTVRDTYCPLVAGTTLYLLERQDTSLFRYCATLAGEPLSYLKVTPSELHAEAEGCTVADIEAATGILVVGGEAMTASPLLADLAASPRVALANHYGPSEVSVGSTFAWIDAEEYARSRDTGRALPIGRPIANTTVYVLDSRGRLAPIGVPGELYIGGIGVSRGYRGRPELTGERFVPDRFGDRPGGRLYRTGDLVRYREDGNLEFLGRLDHQVKIRGYRIEPGEVEGALTRLPEVAAAVAVVREDVPGDRRLVAYVVGREPGLDLAALRRHLVGTLPGYLIPASLMELPAIPLLAGRKVDRKALPAPRVLRDETAPFVPPRGPVEELIADIWAQLLGLDRVGATDDFFDLGGHSLLVTRMVSRLREAFDIEVPFRAVYDSPRLDEVAAAVESLTQKGGAATLPPIARAPRDENLPLSFPQQRLWFLDQLIPENPFYNLPAAYRIRGRLDVGALQRALDALVARHELLRTVFVNRPHGQAVQVVSGPSEVALPIVDVVGDTPRELTARAFELASAEAAKLFDLGTGPVLRATLLRIGPDDHVLVLVLHHAVADGWSVGVLNRDLSILYKAELEGRSDALAPLPVQYADYAVWQHRWLAGEVLDEQLAYWREKLLGAPPVLELPADRPRPPVSSYEGATHVFTIAPEIADRLRELARSRRATLYMVLLAAFKTLLMRYTGQSDIVVGTPVANRRRAELENLVGFFINSLVLRTDCSGDPTFTELLERVRATTLGAYAHQDVPFERLVDELSPPRDLSRNPLVQVGMQLQNMPQSGLWLPGADVSFFLTNKLTTHLDAEFYLAEVRPGVEQVPDLTPAARAALADAAPGCLVGQVVYSTQLFDAATVERMVEHFRTVLTAVGAAPEARLGEIDILGPDQRAELVAGFNDTTREFPSEFTVAGLVERRAALAPDAPAVVCGSRTLTYRELDERANQLAHALRDWGVGTGETVAVCLHRGELVPVAMLAVFKAGGVYAPLDPGNPTARVEAQLTDLRPRVVLTQRDVAASLSYPGSVIHQLDTGRAEIARWPVTAPGVHVRPDDLAYVIYTSGSTGTPKGVEVEHRGLTNLVECQGRLFGIGPGSRTTHAFGPAFDAALSATVLPLTQGGTLVVQPEEEFRFGDQLAAHLLRHRVTTLHLPASVLKSIPEGDFPDLAAIGTGAEPVTPDLARRWAAGRRMYNAYGPTETTVVSVMGRCTPEMGDSRSVAIGTPIDNATAYVVDSELRLVPVGVPGELLIGGVCVARGYRAEPELTRRRFIPDPFDARPGGRLYRTGDLVRRLPDGRLEFLGRLDEQVKLRGHRIELGEIEAVLGRHPDVADAVLTVREDRPGDRRLVGYVRPQTPDVDPGVLRAYLKEVLPGYLVPSLLVPVTEFPLLPSGKVDRAALPEPPGVRAGLGDGFVAPRTPAEEALARLWADLLGLDAVGVEDDFFELGGHSMLIVNLIGLIRRRFGVRLSFGDVFESPTVADLARQVEQRLADDQHQKPIQNDVPPQPRAPRHRGSE